MLEYNQFIDNETRICSLGCYWWDGEVLGHCVFTYGCEIKGWVGYYHLTVPRMGFGFMILLVKLWDFGTGFTREWLYIIHYFCDTDHLSMISR